MKNQAIVFAVINALASYRQSQGLDRLLPSSKELFAAVKYSTRIHSDYATVRGYYKVYRDAHGFTVDNISSDARRVPPGHVRNFLETHGVPAASIRWRVHKEADDAPVDLANTSDADKAAMHAEIDRLQAELFKIRQARSEATAARLELERRAKEVEERQGLPKTQPGTTTAPTPAPVASCEPLTADEIRALRHILEDFGLGRG